MNVVVERPPLYVSAAIHAAVLRVDESGIEGAAATALVLRAAGIPEPPELELRVDRPFYFLVTHRRTGAVVFVALVTEPSS